MDSAYGAWVLSLALTGGVLTFLALRLLGDVRPQDYFALSDVISGVEFPVGLWPNLYRLFAPLAIGAMAGLCAPKSPELAGAAAGAVGGILVVWPPIANPYMLDWQLRRRFRQLLLIYAMFVLALTMLGMTGGLTSRALRNAATSDWVGPSLRDVAIGLFGLAVGALLVRGFNWGRRRLEEWPK